MSEIKAFWTVVVCIMLLFSTSGLAISDFQRHELEGKFGASVLKLSWSEPRRLEGAVEGGGIRHADCSWTFSEDFNSIKVTTKVAGISSSYLLKREGNAYRGVSPSAFGMGQPVKVCIYPDKITGRVGLDKLDITIEPSLESGEIPNLDWIFEEEG